MANEFFNASGYPTTRSAGSSSAMRTQLAAIAAAFDKMPTLTGNGGRLVAVNSGATALEAVNAINGIPIGGTTPAAGAFTTLASSGAATLNSLRASTTLTTGGNVAIRSTANEYGYAVEALVGNYASSQPANGYVMRAQASIGTSTWLGGLIFDSSGAGSPSISIFSPNAITGGAATMQRSIEIAGSGAASQIRLYPGGTLGLTGTTAAWTFATPLLAPLGAASAVGYGFTGDTNTGMFSPGADQLALVVGGSQTTLSTTGFGTGLGGAAPAARMVIGRLGGAPIAPTGGYNTFTTLVSDPGGGTSGSGSAVTIMAGTAGESNIYFGDNDDADVGRIRYAHSADALIFATNGNAEHARLDSAGRWGLGMTPVYKTDVTGGNGDGYRYTGGTSQVLLGEVGNIGALGTLTNHALQFLTNSVERMRITNVGQVQFQNIHNNASGASGTTPMIASGTYTPTITNVSHLASSTAYACQWIRVGNVVHVSGNVTLAGDAVSTLTEARLSLPIASALTANNHLGGSGMEILTPTALSLAICARAVSDDADLFFTPLDTSSHTFAFNFTYVVL